MKLNKYDSKVRNKLCVSLISLGNTMVFNYSSFTVWFKQIKMALFCYPPCFCVFNIIYFLIMVALGHFSYIISNMLFLIHFLFDTHKSSKSALCFPLDLAIFRNMKPRLTVGLKIAIKPYLVLIKHLLVAQLIYYMIRVPSAIFVSCLSVDFSWTSLFI